jgi:hypothetical protein
MSQAKKDKIGFYQCHEIGDCRHECKKIGRDFLVTVGELVAEGKIAVPTCNCDDNGEYCREQHQILHDQ